jgi:hypothetical protein
MNVLNTIRKQDKAWTNYENTTAFFLSISILERLEIQVLRGKKDNSNITRYFFILVGTNRIL